MFRAVKNLYLCVLGKLGNILFYTTHEKERDTTNVYEYKRYGSKVALTAL